MGADVAYKVATWGLVQVIAGKVTLQASDIGGKWHGRQVALLAVQIVLASGGIAGSADCAGCFLASSCENTLACHPLRLVLVNGVFLPFVAFTRIKLTWQVNSQGQ